MTREKRFLERLAKLPTLALSADDELSAEWAAMAGDAPEGEITRVLSQDEIDSLLGFDMEGEMGKDGEPSMEDILASIRRILTEDDPPQPKPSLWSRLHRRLFPTRAAIERMATRLETLAAETARLRERLSRIRVLTQREIDDLLSFDDSPSPYAVRREIERLRGLIADVDLCGLVDHLKGLQAVGHGELFGDSLLLVALEGKALRQETLAGAFPAEIVGVIDRISCGVTLSTERVAAVADSLQRRLDTSFRYDEVKGVPIAAVLADSIRQPAARRHLIGTLLVDGKPRDAVTHVILEKLITFDSLPRLTDDHLRLFLADTTVRPKLPDCALALKGKPDALRDQILHCLSPEDAAELLQLMEAMGPVQEKAVEKAEVDVVVALKVFMHEGAIPWPLVLGVDVETGER